MENRRSTTSKPSGPKRYYDENRGTPPHRRNTSDGRGRPERRDGTPLHDRERRIDNHVRAGRKSFGPKGKGRSFSKDANKFTSRQDKPTGRKPWNNQNRIKITSDLQITDGKHRGRLLETKPTATCDITPRKIREIMFKIVLRRVRAGRFLEICAGPGVIGMEAISRGAMIGSFVERSSRMCSYIRRNLEAAGVLKGHGEVFEIEALPFLIRMRKRRRFWDVVYCNLPGETDYSEYLKFFGNGVAVRPGGMLLIEHPSATAFPEQIGLLKRWKVVAEGETSLTFFERK